MNFCLLLFIGLCTIFDITYGTTLKEECLAEARANQTFCIDDITNRTNKDMRDCDEKFKVGNDDPQQLMKCKETVKETLNLLKVVCNRDAELAKAACSTCKKALEDKKKCDQNAIDGYFKEEKDCEIDHGTFTSGFYYCRNTAFRKYSGVTIECQATYDSDQKDCLDSLCKKADENKKKCEGDAIKKSNAEWKECGTKHVADSLQKEQCDNKVRNNYRNETYQCQATYESDKDECINPKCKKAAEDQKKCKGEVNDKSRDKWDECKNNHAADFLQKQQCDDTVRSYYQNGIRNCHAAYYTNECHNT